MSSARRGGRSASQIVVDASDDIMVAKVYATIFGEKDKVLEMGDSVRQEGNMWEITCHSKGKAVRAQAFELANNHTQLVV